MYSFSVGNIFATGSLFLFNLKAQLKLAGWTVKSSGDGTTFFSSTDGITTGATGAGGMNANTWWRIQSPAISGITRELTFQISATGGANWRVKYSYSTGFTTGGSATQTPSASDEAIFAGSGTDSSPIFTPICDNASRSAQFCCGNSAENYSFYALQTNAGALSCLFMFDYCDNTNAVDPVVLFTASGATGFTAVGNVFTSAIAASGPKAWLGKGKSYETFTGVAALAPNRTGSIYAPKTLGTNPYTGVDNLFPLFYGRGAALTTVPVSGYKGRSHLVQWCGTSHPQSDTYNTQIFLQLQDFVVPWNGSVPSL